jgi:hypothetical protein
MFSDQEKSIIIMALIYFKNDCSVEDIKELGFDVNDDGCSKCESMAQTLIEDFIGPTWDEDATSKVIEDQQLKLFSEPEE